MRPDADLIFAPLDLEGQRTVLVAISGGSDSTALLLLFKSFATRHAPSLRIFAATVDHGLRTGSAAEARHVASFCLRHGIEHVTLSWTGAKPKTGLPAAARMARYRLLAGCARSLGADIVLLGHTADDQAETVAMRRTRGEGGDRRGDAGMATLALFEDEIWFVRPLLSTRRADLRDFLAGVGETWIDDPTNSSPAFERARLRAAGGLPDERPDAARERIAANGVAARSISTHVGLPSPGLFRIDRDFFGRNGLTAFRLLLAVAGGGEHLPDAARSRALFEAAAGSANLRATLSRTVVDARRDAVWLHRESRDLPAIDLPAGGTVWDGRWRIAAAPPDGLSVAPIGARANGLAGPVPAGASQALVRNALAAEPGLWRGGDFLGPLAESPVPACLVLGPWQTLLPGFDLAPAAALRALAGLPELPPAPWRDHNRIGA